MSYYCAVSPTVDKRLQEAAGQAGLTIDELAGAGASGAVYRARVTSSGRVVALKVLRPLADAARFEREVATLGALRSDGVPELIASGDLDGQPFLATDWVTGRSLAELLQDGALSPNRAIDLFGQLATILDAVHEAGIVHRDLSPANILVDDEGRVHLIDFGVSNQQDDVTLTADGVAPGTPRYLAPEVLAGADATPASDQYGAAVVLYEMLTGRFAYRASADTLATTLHDHVHGTVIVPSEANPWLPTSLDPPIQRALEKDPKDRFDAMTAFAEALHPTTSTQSDRRPGLAGVKVATLLVGAGLLGLAGGWLLRGDNSGEALSVPYLASIPDWRSGQATRLGCNLIPDPGFESGTIPVSFYVQDADRNALVDDIGVGRTTALLVGTTNEYGLYGEVVPVSPATPYVFSLSIDPVGAVESAELRISWLDADFSAIGDDITFDLDPQASGRVTLETGESPDGAAFAVPTVEKRGISGSLVIDEVVFADANEECASQVRPG